MIHQPSIVRDQCGQSLLLAVFILLLLGLSVPLIILVNQAGSWHQVSVQKKSRALNVAEEGISYGVRALAPTWQTVLNTSTFPAECTSGAKIDSASGGKFSITCDKTTAGLRPYQVAVTATAWIKDNSGNETILKKVRAFVSRRTLSAVLTTRVHADSAVVLTRKPVIANNQLRVHWGPVVCLEPFTGGPPSPWTLYDPMNSQLYPRKFAQGGIQGAGSAAGSATYRTPSQASVTSDRMEYWAFNDLGFIPVIDTQTYVNVARTQSYMASMPTCTGGGSVVRDGACGGNQCGVFIVTAPCTLVFDNTFTVSNSQGIVFVSGVTPTTVVNVRFQNLNVDMSNGAFIVDGNLDLNTRIATSGTDLNLNVPNTAHLEYPYYKSDGTGTPTAWPCSANEGATCLSSVADTGASPKTNFRGFLWASGNVTVTAQEWHMAGSMLVGNPWMSGTTGILDTSTGTGSLYFYYDDLINHQILTKGVELQIDSQVELRLD